jgi:hypothetical protein
MDPVLRDEVDPTVKEASKSERQIETAKRTARESVNDDVHIARRARLSPRDRAEDPHIGGTVTSGELQDPPAFRPDDLGDAEPAPVRRYADLGVPVVGALAPGTQPDVRSAGQPDVTASIAMSPGTPIHDPIDK